LNSSIPGHRSALTRIARQCFDPFTAVAYLSLRSTITSAASEIDAGAALRASAISAFSSGIKY